MDEEIMLALNQDARLYLRSVHVREINKVVKKRRKDLFMDLFWELNFARRYIIEAKEWYASRWSRWFWWIPFSRRYDRQGIERAQQRYDDVVDKIHSAGLLIEGEKESGK